MELFVSQVYTKPHGFTAGIEGPACDSEGNIYAVNYSREHTIGRVTPLGECSIYVELPNGSNGSGIRFNRAGDMFIADHANHNILKVDKDTKEISVHAHEPKMNQPNDICITPNGWLFASDPNWSEETGQIWRIDPNGDISLMESGMGTTNGIEVSPDGTKLYVNETVQRNIWCYDLYADQQISNKTLFHHFDEHWVDGMRCDVEGNLYVTRYGKGTVVKLSPQGDLLKEIKLHGKNCTNLTFGGKDGRTCYVTLADQGNLEMFKTDIAGRCWNMWREGSP